MFYEIDWGRQAHSTPIDIACVKPCRLGQVVHQAAKANKLTRGDDQFYREDIARMLHTVFKVNVSLLQHMQKQASLGNHSTLRAPLNLALPDLHHKKRLINSLINPETQPDSHILCLCDRLFAWFRRHRAWNLGTSGLVSGRQGRKWGCWGWMMNRRRVGSPGRSLQPSSKRLLQAWARSWTKSSPWMKLCSEERADALKSSGKKFLRHTDCLLWEYTPPSHIHYRNIVVDLFGNLYIRSTTAIILIHSYYSQGG